MWRIGQPRKERKFGWIANVKGDPKFGDPAKERDRNTKGWQGAKERS